MSKLSQLRQYDRSIDRRHQHAAPQLPVNVGVVVTPAGVILGIEGPGQRPALAPLKPSEARELAIGLISAAVLSEQEAKRLEAVKAQAQAELAAHPSNDPAPEPVSSAEPGPIIVLPT